MITFYELGNYGRLGNQLFQYAALKSLGITKGFEVKIPEYRDKIWHGQKCLLDNFLLECGTLTHEDLNKISSVYEENFCRDMRHDHRFLTIADNTNIRGYFQNLRYFSEHEEQIRKEFRLKSEINDQAVEHIDKLKKETGCSIVSLHVRRGDQVDGTNPNTVNFYGKNNILSSDSIYGKYLHKAKNIFSEQNVKFLIFSGGSRGSDDNLSDLEWCRKNFTGSEYLFSSGTNTIEDFALMKNCDHNITCHMTSFGWWAAYLNENKQKIVVAPRHYDIEDQKLERKNFYPKNWILI